MTVKELIEKLRNIDGEYSDLPVKFYGQEGEEIVNSVEVYYINDKAIEVLIT